MRGRAWYRRPVVAFGVVWVPLLLWWLAMFPASMSPDSFNSWLQIRTGHWTSHHPVPYTAFVWLTSGGGRTPAGVSLAQTVLMAAALAFLARVLDEQWRTGPAPLVAAASLAALPFAGPFAVTLWKDVPETAAMLALAGLLLRARGARPGSLPAGWWAATVLVSLTAALVRWNGVVSVVIAGAVGAIGLAAKLRWRVLAAVAGAGVAGFAVLWAIPAVAPVAPLPKVDTQLQQLADLAQFVRHAPGALHADDRAVLRQVAPLGQWARAGRTCLDTDPVAYELITWPGREPALDRASGRLSAVWRRVALRAPGELAAARLCRASLAWRPTDPGNRPIQTIWTRVAGNREGPDIFGIHPTPPVLALRRAGVRVGTLSHEAWVQDVAWRPAPWLLAVLLLWLVVRRRVGDRALPLALAVPLGVDVSFAVEPAAQSGRYVYSAVLACQLVAVAWVAVALSRRRPRR